MKEIFSYDENLITNNVKKNIDKCYNVLYNGGKVHGKKRSSFIYDRI